MRFYRLFYVAALISVAGMWLQWDWVKGTFDGWFPFFAVVSGQLARIRGGYEPDVFDRVFSVKGQRWALASIVAVVLGITLWGAWLNYVELPRSRAESVEQFKKDWAAYQERKK